MTIEWAPRESKGYGVGHEADVIDPDAEEIDIPHGPGPFSPAERQQVVKWIGQGVARNEIARRTGRGVATIGRIAEVNGLKFDRASQMAPALEARAFDVRKRRLDLAHKLLDRAHEMADEITRPGMIYFPDYKNSKAIRVKTNAVIPGDKRNLMTAIGIAVDKVAELERLDAPQEGKQAVITMVEMMRLHVKPAEGLPEPD